MCQFDISKLGLYSFSIVFILSLIVSFSILLNDRKNQVNKNAFAFLFIISLWVGDNIILGTVHNIKIHLFANQLSMLLIFFLLYFLYFAHYFSEKELSRKKKIILALPIVPIVALLFTKYNVYLIDASRCNEGEGWLNWYAYLVAVIYAIWSIALFLEKYRDKSTSYQVRNQIKILIISIAYIVLWTILFLIIGNYTRSRGNIIDEEITSFSLLGVMFFISLISFAITKYWLFKFRITSTKALVTILWMILLIMLFFINKSIAYSVVAFILYSILLLIFWIL